MESPHHGALDPGSHPRTATEAAHPGAYGHCNTIQMYESCWCGCVQVCNTHMFFSLRVWACAREGSVQIKIFSCHSSDDLRGLGYFHVAGKFTENPEPRQPLKCSLKGCRLYPWGMLIERQAVPWRQVSAGPENGKDTKRKAASETGKSLKKLYIKIVCLKKGAESNIHLIEPGPAPDWKQSGRSPRYTIFI